MEDLQSIIVMAVVAIASVFGIVSKVKHNSNVKKAEEEQRRAQEKLDAEKKKLEEQQKKTDKAIEEASGVVKDAEDTQNSIKEDAKSNLEDEANKEALNDQRIEITEGLSEGEYKDALENAEIERLKKEEEKINEGK